MMFIQFKTRLNKALTKMCNCKTMDHARKGSYPPTPLKPLAKCDEIT